jgi:hypothetical protein
MDKAEFIEEAPVYYALAIAASMARSSHFVSKNTIAKEFFITLDDNDPESSVNLLSDATLWNRAVVWLQSRDMLAVKTHTFGPPIYGRGEGYSEAWSALTQTDGIFKTYDDLRDGDNWLFEALRAIHTTREALSITEEDFVPTERASSRIADPADPFSPPPDNFDGLLDADVVRSITSWFFENFEAQGARFDAEGEAIWGGPYNTRGR